jgi:hypothetical protein
VILSCPSPGQGHDILPQPADGEKYSTASVTPEHKNVLHLLSNQLILSANGVQLAAIGRCPGICQTTLREVTEWQQQLINGSRIKHVVECHGREKISPDAIQQTEYFVPRAENEAVIRDFPSTTTETDRTGAFLTFTQVKATDHLEMPRRGSNSSA